LLELTPPVSPDLRAVWEAAAEASLAESDPGERERIAAIPEQFLILVTCRDEQHQIELLRRFQSEGMACRAVVS
jgi:hypothetical protein